MSYGQLLRRVRNIWYKPWCKDAITTNEQISIKNKRWPLHATREKLNEQTPLTAKSTAELLSTVKIHDHSQSAGACQTKSAKEQSPNSASTPELLYAPQQMEKPRSAYALELQDNQPVLTYHLESKYNWTMRMSLKGERKYLFYNQKIRDHTSPVIR